jgi:hypothetical protein
MPPLMSSDSPSRAEGGSRWCLSRTQSTAARILLCAVQFGIFRGRKAPEMFERSPSMRRSELKYAMALIPRLDSLAQNHVVDHGGMGMLLHLPPYSPHQIERRLWHAGR